MNTEEKNAKIVGVLFIIASAAPILTYPFTGFLYERVSDYLSKINENEFQVMIGMFLELIWALAVFFIPVMLYPILKKKNESGAIGFLGLRFIEAIGNFIGIIILLSLVTLSKEFVNAGSPADSSYIILSDFLLGVRDWVFVLGPGIFFGLSALFLNYMLYKSELVPRWLSLWGLIAFPFYISYELFSFFEIILPELLYAPLALQEMAFAVWLIVKGFNTSAIYPDAVK